MLCVLQLQAQTAILLCFLDQLVSKFPRTFIIHKAACVRFTFVGEDVPEVLFSFSKLKLATSMSKALREGMKRSICRCHQYSYLYT